MKRRLVILAGIVAVLWVVVAGLWLVRIAFDVQAGRHAATRARDHLGAEEVADRKPLADLKKAARRFGAANDRANGIVLAPLRVVPVIGRQIRSVRALSDAAEGVALAGVDAVERAGKVFDDPAAAGHGRVVQVRELSAVVDDISARLDEVHDLGPVHGLVSPLAHAHNELAADLDDARRNLADARTGARAALSLVEGPRKYLVVAANNAEMRAGSGMWLQGGLLHTNDGDLELDPMLPLGLDVTPPTGAVTPTGDLADRWGFLRPGDEWRNLMPSPRFEQSARLAVEMWKAAGKGDVDGVIAVDAIGLQAIVEATGPVRLGDTTITAKDVPARILHDQYLQFGNVRSESGVSNAQRREALGVLAKSAVAAINAGDYPASKLIRTLGDAIAGRHLLAWTTDETEQAGWVAGGMDGELGRDSLLVSILNRGANKLDWFLDVRADLSVKRTDAGWDVAVSLRIRNETPAGQPRYIAGPYPGIDLEPGAYRGIVAVNVPGDARNSRFDGVASLAVAGADGKTRVVGFLLDLLASASRTVVLRYSLPGTADHVVVEPSARVPEIRWRYGSSTWRDEASRTVKW